MCAHEFWHLIPNSDCLSRAIRPCPVSALGIVAKKKHNDDDDDNVGTAFLKPVILRYINNFKDCEANERLSNKILSTRGTTIDDREFLLQWVLIRQNIR